MTLDEAIKRFESVKLYKNFEEYIEDCGDSRVKDGIKICGNPVNSLLFRGYGICDEDHCPDYKKCVERAEEHRQLAEWLRELKRLKEQTWSLDDAREDFMYDVYKTLESLPTNDEANRIIEVFDRVTSDIRQGLCDDAIDRQAVIDEIEFYQINPQHFDFVSLIGDIKGLPSVTPTQKWIPVSERLPDDRDWYFGIFRESDTGWINPLPFVCDYVGHETKATTKEHWILRGFTDRDEHIDYYFNLECVAWMPLPEPYKAESEEEQMNERAKFLKTNDDQAKRIAEIREQFSYLYDYIEKNCKPSRETSLAFTKLEEAQFWAIKGITREE